MHRSLTGWSGYGLTSFLAGKIIAMTNSLATIWKTKFLLAMHNIMGLSGCLCKHRRHAKVLIEQKVVALSSHKNFSRDESTNN